MKKNNPTGGKLRAEKRDIKRQKAKSQQSDNRSSIRLIAKQSVKPKK